MTVARHRFGETRLPITFAGRSRGVVILTRMKSVLQQMSAGVVPGAHRLKKMPGSLLVYGGDVSRRLTLSNTHACLDCAPSKGRPLWYSTH